MITRHLVNCYCNPGNKYKYSPNTQHHFLENLARFSNIKIHYRTNKSGTKDNSNLHPNHAVQEGYRTPPARSVLLQPAAKKPQTLFRAARTPLKGALARPTRRAAVH